MGIQWDSTSGTYVPLESLWLSRKQSLYNIVTGFGMFMEQVGLIKMHLSDTCSNVCIRKHLCVYDIWVPCGVKNK